MIKRTIIGLAVMVTMSGAMAQEITTNKGQWFIGAGTFNDYDKYSFGYKTAPMWKATNSNVDLNLEY